MLWFPLFYVLVLNVCAVCTLCAFSYFSLGKGNSVATFWEIAAHSAYEMLSKYKVLTVKLVFPRLGFWSGTFFLIAPFPDHCLLVPFSYLNNVFQVNFVEISGMTIPLSHK